MLCDVEKEIGRCFVGGGYFEIENWLARGNGYGYAGVDAGFGCGGVGEESEGEGGEGGEGGEEGGERITRGEGGFHCEGTGL